MYQPLGSKGSMWKAPDTHGRAGGGGRHALQTDWDDVEPEGNGRRKSKVRREARKKKLRAEREELQHLRKGLKGGGGKGSGASGAKGGHSEEARYAWNNLCGV